ncbi:RGG repeats nuclear RNA binding protein A-like [Magnolia sinica]|uniref:RGG repeats nuclear RNA binding protein A-like n=1 Tax=Magnolia sinica TaxID=86752 RepID=UPI00265885F2|nr:RGG repeats nuclear RNA binding protein A-like [Magnolia sinica]
MATANPFDLLGDDDNDDPSQLIAKEQQKAAVKKTAAAAAPPAPAKLPSKPLPPAQAVKEARSEAPAVPPRGGGRGGAVRGRGGRGSSSNRDIGSNGNINGFSGSYARSGEDGEMNRPSERGRGTYGPPRQSFRGGRRGGYGNGEGGDIDRPPRRQFDRHSGMAHGNMSTKRDGAGQGNWGTVTDEVVAQEHEEITNTEDKILTPDKQPEQEDAPASDVNKESKEDPTNEVEEKEAEEKEMTLAEYEKILEEKRKGLTAMKTEERKVVVDKEFKAMQLLSIKKENDDVFIKLGSGKDSGKRKENADGSEKAKKSLSINEFLKPAEGESYYSPGGRGRGRGRGDRRPFRGGFASGSSTSVPAAPSIEDQGEFPTLGGK